VEDTGIGIREEDQHGLFKEFHQVDPHGTKGQEGTGLGLALVKRIVEAQGGAVGVRSVAGEGSVFYATLPNAFRPRPELDRKPPFIRTDPVRTREPLPMHSPVSRTRGH
jgi:signal transduction histidine kinase